MQVIADDKSISENNKKKRKDIESRNSSSGKILV